SSFVTSSSSGLQPTHSLDSRATQLSFRPMAFLDGELIFANVLDVQQRTAQGDAAPGSVVIVAQGSRALPFVCIRDWKAPTGYLTEEIELISPSAKITHRV